MASSDKKVSVVSLSRRKESYQRFNSQDQSEHQALEQTSSNLPLTRTVSAPRPAMERFLAKLPKAPQPARQFLAEMMGTFILLTFGIGSVAQYVLGSDLKVPFLSVNFGWGLGCMFGVYWSAAISGGHINPAVTLAMGVCGRLPLYLVPIYWAGQTVGAFLGSAVCYGVYYDLLMKNNGTNALGNSGIWTTYANDGISNASGFGDQVVGTALLVSTVFALTDKRGNPPAGHILPLLIGLLVTVIGISFGTNAGYGINPARDLVPRIFVAIAGWGEGPFTAHNYWFWVAVAGQLIGGVIGALLYLFTIEMHHPVEDAEPVEKVDLVVQQDSSNL